MIERGVIRKAKAEANVALVYPDSYYIGMSNLGFHTIYYELNRRNDTSCERAFSDSTGESRAGCKPKEAGHKNLGGWLPAARF